MLVKGATWRQRQFNETTAELGMNELLHPTQNDYFHASI